MGIAFAALVLLTLAIAPISAQATNDTFLYPDYIDYTVPYSGGSDYIYPDYIDYSYPVSDTLYPDYIDYSYSPTYDYGYGYSAPSYSSGGYSYYTPSYSIPSYSQPSKSSSNSSSNTEVCNAENSCNTNYSYDLDYNYESNVEINIEGDTDKKRYDNDRKVSYQAPYVSLSQVPYTGLELGPVGTALYWSFLVLWCLVAAYLIVVKRVQNTLLSKLNVFLFGEPGATQATSQGLSEREIEHYASMLRSSAKKHEVAKSEDETDEFVLAQINRSRN
jgi:hypothetical protein